MLLFLCAINTVLSLVLEESLVRLCASMFIYLLFAVPFGLCLNAKVVRELCGCTQPWYYVVSIVSGRVANDFMFTRTFWTVAGEVNVSRRIVTVAETCSVTLCLLVTLALMVIKPAHRMRIVRQHTSMHMHRMRFILSLLPHSSKWCGLA